MPAPFRNRKHLWLMSALAVIVLLGIYLIQTEASSKDPSPDVGPIAAGSSSERASSDVELAPSEPLVARSIANDGEAPKVTGRATTPDGQPVAGASVRVGQSSEDLSEKTGASTDIRGEFSLQIPPHWTSVYARISTDAGARGSATAPISDDRDTAIVDLGTIVVQRHTDVTLKWRLGDDAGQLLQEHGLVLSVFAREHKQTSLLGPKPSTQELCNVDVTLFDGTTSAEVLMADPAEICWAIRQPHELPAVFLTDPIPEGAEAYESSCTIDQRMMLLGRVIDPNNAPVSNVKVRTLAFFGSGQGMGFEMVTDASGRFFGVVPAGSFGTVEVVSSFGVSPTNAKSRRSASWVPGAPVTLVVDPSHNLLFEVVDSDGQPVTDYYVSNKPHPTRDRDGRLGESMLMHAPEGISYSSLRELKPGTKLFVQLPDSGEYVHEVSEHVTPSAEPYRITVGRLVLGSVTVKLRISQDKNPPGRGFFVTIRDGIDDTPKHWDYRFGISVDSARAGYTAKFVHPGTYQFVASINGTEVASGNVTVEAGKESTIEVVL